jgi:hypothetical protein
VVASPTLDGFLPVHASLPWTPRGGSDNPLGSSRPTFTSQKTSTTAAAGASWSSYVTVDPSNIISLLVKTAGFFLDPKLQQLAYLLRCDEAKLNVVNREVLIDNFTLSIPNQHQFPALRIGRIHVSWDSYTRPCLEVQVEDVDILVEFTNLLLTRNNW